MRGMPARWEFFLSEVEGPPPPPVRTALRLRAAANTARGLRLLDEQGWGAAHKYLQRLTPGPGTSRYPRIVHHAAIRLARREIFYSNLALRLVDPAGLCLARSFALATYLCTLGLPAEVTVAVARIHRDPRYRFHSWAELYGEVLNDYPETPLGFTVLQRVTSGQLHAAD